MDKKHIIERQGKPFVLYAGLLDAAHAAGLCRVSTVIIQIPHPDNGNTAIVHAEVETSKGTFSGIGDASPTNVGQGIKPHIVRMAETRAKARAMRDAINVGEASAEELGGDDDGGFVDAATGEIVNGHRPTPQRDTPAGAGVGTAPPEPPSNALDSPLKVPIKREMLAICHQEQVDSQDVLEWLQKTIKFSGPISGQLHATQERILAALMERRLKVTA